MASRVAVSAGALAAVVAAGVGIHLAYLALNMGAVSVLRLGGEGPEGTHALAHCAALRHLACLIQSMAAVSPCDVHIALPLPHDLHVTLQSQASVSRPEPQC